MKIVSWNINGYRAITGQNKKKRFDKTLQENSLFEYIEKENPDIACLQETKAHPMQLEPNLKAPKGYNSYFSACKIKKGYSGVAIYTKKEPGYTNENIGEQRFDDEGRVLEIGFDDLIIYNVYFPNGKRGPERVKYKLEFYDKLFEEAEKRRQDSKKVIISGDYNTAHKRIDLARPDNNKKTSGFLPEEREKLDEIVEMGYVDTFREFNQEPDNYTWWSQRARARERNVGWRIDYHFVGNELKDKLKNSYHQPKQMGSDHCPIVLELDMDL